MSKAFPDIKYWMPLNETGYWFVNAFGTRKFPVPKRGLVLSLKIYFNLIKAHKAAYANLKKSNNDFMIGIVESTGSISPAFFRYILFWPRNFVFAWLVRDYFDFFGVNYYQNATLFGKVKNDVSEIGWEIYPAGLYRVIFQAYKYFRKPIFITENGIADSTDQKRAKFIKDHITQIHKAIQNGVDVRGYFYWSLMDNFEWDKGFWPRFGLVEVDYKSMARKIRQSAWEYAKLIKEQTEK